MTISRKNFDRPAPRWFRKTKKSITILSDSAVVMLLAMGYGENSMAMLIARVAVSGVLNSIEAFIAE